MTTESIYNLNEYTMKYKNNVKQVFSYKPETVKQISKKQPLYNNKSLDKESKQKLNRLNKSLDFESLRDKKVNFRISNNKYSSPQKAGPFEKNRLTNFGFMYLSNNIPVKLIHGNVNLKIVWQTKPVDLPYDNILITCFEGLLEQTHPYSFLARQCLIELILAQNAKNKILPLIPVCVKNLRYALSHNNEQIYSNALSITRLFTEVLQESIIPSIKILIQPLNKISLNLKYKEAVLEVYKLFEKYGGKEALKLIKSKIPSYIGNI